MGFIKGSPAQSTGRLINIARKLKIPIYCKGDNMIALLKRTYKNIDVRKYDLKDIKKRNNDFCIFKIDNLTVDEFLDLNERLKDKELEVYFNCFNPLLDFDYTGEKIKSK